MQLFDIIKDKDTYIDGMIIHKEKDQLNVLWSNGVIGSATDDLRLFSFAGHRNVQRYMISDILHTGYSGPEGKRKEGAKYDQIRGKAIILDPDLLDRGKGVVLHLYDKKFFDILPNCGVLPDDNEVFDIYTTNFEKLYEEYGDTMLRTRNSIYVLKPF